MTIADFRRDNGPAICAACAQFIVVCRNLGLFTRPPAAIDGGKVKGVNAPWSRARSWLKAERQKLNRGIFSLPPIDDCRPHFAVADANSISPPYIVVMTELIVWHDGRCPLCAREIALMRRLDRKGAITFVDAAQEESGCPVDRAAA